LTPQLRQFGKVVIGVVRHNAGASGCGLGLESGRDNHTRRLRAGQLRLVLWVVEKTQRIGLCSVKGREALYFEVGVAHQTTA